MFSHDLIEEYTNTICQQIRWKKARFRVSEEMTNHIVDLRDLYMEQGTDEETATKKAIAETGDAVTIGIQFDRIHRPKLQWGMLLATAILLIFGILVRLFIFNDEDRIGLISIRLICTGIGIAGLLAAYFTDFTIIGKYPKITYISITSVSIILIILSRKINSMKFYAGYVQYIVLLFPLAFSAIVFVLRNKGYLGIILCGLVYTFSCYVAFYISSISGLLHFLIIGTTILLIAIYKKWFGLKKIYGFLVFIPSVLMTCLLFLQLQSYGAWERLKIIFNPASDLLGAGYIVMMIKKLINGAVFLAEEISPKNI